MPPSWSRSSAALAVSLPGGAATPPPSPVLALIGNGTTESLAWLDPATLRPAAGRRSQVYVGLHDIPHAFSPDGSLLAMGSGRTSSVVVVDLARMRFVGRLADALHRCARMDLATAARPDRERQELVALRVGRRGRTRPPSHRREVAAACSERADRDVHRGRIDRSPAQPSGRARSRPALRWSTATACGR